MNNKEFKSIDLVYILQPGTELGDKFPKYITGQISVPVPDDLPCNKLVTFTETATKGKKKHYDHLVETPHFSMARRDDQKFYIAQRKGITADEVTDTEDWKVKMLVEFNEVLDKIETISKTTQKTANLSVNQSVN